MYYIVYGFLYLLSLLPFFIVYRISDFAYVLLYHVFGYRKKLVMNNLLIAFPEMTEAERIKVAKKFYRNFTDTFIEIIKTLSMSDAMIEKRNSGNFEIVNDLIDKGRNVQMMGGHMFNWEYANLIFSKKVKRPIIGPYSKITSKVIERLFLKIRSRYGTIMIPTATFRENGKELTKNQYVIFLGADQNPQPQNGYWLNFFNKPIPLVWGPYKAAIKNDAAIVFVNSTKIRRGYYRFNCETAIENPTEFTPEQLALKFRDFLQESVKNEPDNYLCTHLRWRYEFRDIFRDLWIDDKAPCPL